MNPKGKKSITLTVPEELDLTGKELKRGISQLYRLYLGIIDREDMDLEILKKFAKL